MTYDDVVKLTNSVALAVGLRGAPVSNVDEIYDTEELLDALVIVFDLPVNGAYPEDLLEIRSCNELGSTLWNRFQNHFENEWGN